MSAHIIRSAWRHQPHGVMRPARTGLTQGLRMLYTRGVNAVTGDVAVPVGEVPQAVTAQGIAHGPVASDSNYMLIRSPFSAGVSTGLDGSCAVLVLSSGGGGGVVSGKTEGSGVGLRILGAAHGQYADNLYIGNNRFSSGPYGGGLYRADADLNCYALRADSADIGFYVNGLRNTAAYYVGSSSDWDPALTHITIQAQPGVGYATTTSTLLIAMWERNLSNEELAAATADPWRLFEPRRIVIPLSAAPTAPNITAVYADGVTTSSVTPRVTLDFA